MALQASANPSQLAETKYSTTETITRLGNMQILFLAPQVLLVVITIPVTRVSNVWQEVVFVN